MMQRELLNQQGLWFSMDFTWLCRFYFKKKSTVGGKDSLDDIKFNISEIKGK